MNKIRVYPHRACISEKADMYLKKKIEDKTLSTGNRIFKNVLENQRELLSKGNQEKVRKFSMEGK